MELVANSPEIICATRSFEATRLARSPAKRWPKNVIGRVTTCQKKRELATSESLASMRAMQICCNQVSTPWAIDATPRPISNGVMSVSLRGIRTSSTNTFDRVGIVSPGTTSSSVAATTKKSGDRALPRRESRLDRTFGRRPPRLNSGPGWNARQTPVKPSSNSSSDSLRRPSPGSLMCAVRPVTPSRTTKWLKFQKTIIGKGRSNRFAGSRR